LTCTREREAKLKIEPPGLEFVRVVANSAWIQLRGVLGCCGQDRWRRCRLGSNILKSSAAARFRAHRRKQFQPIMDIYICWGKIDEAAEELEPLD
jgi:hypothetical protein